MPRTKHSLSTNPVRKCREELNMTLEDMSRAVGCHIQALYNCESGVYPRVLPEILHFLKRKGYSQVDLTEKYTEFVERTRESFKDKHFPYELPKPHALRSPVSLWREGLGLSRAGLSKALCVQPSLLYRCEQGLSQGLPRQLTDALRDVGMTKDLIDELSYRQAEFHFASK